MIVLAIYGLGRDNYRFSLVDASVKCSVSYTWRLVTQETGGCDCGYTENLWWKQIACFRFPEIDRSVVIILYHSVL